MPMLALEHGWLNRNPCLSCTVTVVHGTTWRQSEYVDQNKDPSDQPSSSSTLAYKLKTSSTATYIINLTYCGGTVVYSVGGAIVLSNANTPDKLFMQTRLLPQTPIY